MAVVVRRVVICQLQVRLATTKPQLPRVAAIVVLNSSFLQLGVWGPATVSFGEDVHMASLVACSAYLSRYGEGAMFTLWLQ